MSNDTHKLMLEHSKAKVGSADKGNCVTKSILLEGIL